jgi:hypothetical protein
VNETRNREVGEYLRRLQRSMGDLPPSRRDEILAEIEEHIAAELAEVPEPTDADVRNVLERLGDPGDIAAEARDRFGIKPRRPSWTDPLAIILLLVGGFTFVGWFVGVVLLWISAAWKTRDKLIGTLILPGGLASSFLLLNLPASREECLQVAHRPSTTGTISGSVVHTTCVTHPGAFGSVGGQVFLVVLLIAPIATAVYLSWRLHQTRKQVALAS